MIEMTFKKFLQLCSKQGTFGDSPEGDFVYDAVRDNTFREFTQWKDLERYVGFRSRYDAEVIAAAKNVFKRWKAGA